MTHETFYTIAERDDDTRQEIVARLLRELDEAQHRVAAAKAGTAIAMLRQIGPTATRVHFTHNEDGDDSTTVTITRIDGPGNAPLFDNPNDDNQPITEYDLTAVQDYLTGAIEADGSIMAGYLSGYEYVLPLTRPTTAPAAPPPPPIIKMLDLSTDHLPEELHENDGLANCVGVIAYRLRHGWLLWVPAEDRPQAPAPVRAIWDRARFLGCPYVLLDADADVDATLPIYG